MLCHLCVSYMYHHMYDNKTFLKNTYIYIKIEMTQRPAVFSKLCLSTNININIRTTKVHKTINSCSKKWLRGCYMYILHYINK